MLQTVSYPPAFTDLPNGVSEAKLKSNVIIPNRTLIRQMYTYTDLAMCFVTIDTHKNCYIFHENQLRVQYEYRLLQTRLERELSFCSLEQHSKSEETGG